MLAQNGVIGNVSIRELVDEVVGMIITSANAAAFADDRITSSRSKMAAIVPKRSLMRSLFTFYILVTDSVLFVFVTSQPLNCFPFLCIK